MNIVPLLCMLQSAKNTAEEILASQTKVELHAKIECVKQCIEQDHSISDIDKEFYKSCFDLFKKRFELERGW